MKPYKTRAEIIEIALALLLPLLYLLHLDADSISGLVGIYWMDESLYLMAAKNQALFGNPHPYAADKWLPELRTPLVHYLGLLTITQESMVYWTRVAVDLCVIGGAALLGWVAARYHHSRHAGLACFICILLNPVLFFYARLAMAEGIQFLTLACIIAALFQLYRAKKFNRALGWTILAAVLAALLFVSKISALSACVGVSAGALLAIHFNPAIGKKYALAALYTGTGFAAVALYFMAIGPDAWLSWWYTNMAGTQAIGQTPGDLRQIAHVIYYKMPEISYLCMMPVLAVYFPSLVLAANRQKKFLYLLALTTMVIFLIDAVFGPSVRRNFFSLSMLGVLFGFTCMEFIGSGIPRTRPDAAKLLAWMLVLLHLLGAASLLHTSLTFANQQIIILSSLFLALLLIACAASGSALASARKLLLAIAACCSLMLMAFQAFFAPYTIREVASAMERIIDTDSLIAGVRSPVYFQGRGQTVLTNCVNIILPLDFVNDIDPLAAHGRIYYITTAPIEQDPCAPKDIGHYRIIGAYDIFNPENTGMWYDGNLGLTFRRGFNLYEKTGQH